MDTLKERLSHLNLQAARKLLGREDNRLLKEGGRYEVDIDSQTNLGKDVFVMDTGDSRVSITADASSGSDLHIRCSTCREPCEHMGAAVSLILEEKLALGLSAPPPERAPVESLGYEALVEQAIADRVERAQTEKMELNSMDPRMLLNQSPPSPLESAGQGEGGFQS